MTRRQCLAKLGMLAPAFGMVAISASAQRDAAKILIGDYETFSVHVNTRGDWILVRLATNSGIRGIGEASQGASDAATLRYLGQFAARLKGRGIF